MAVIDRERGYIFFHIPKTAGMSVSDALVREGGSRVADDSDLTDEIRVRQFGGAKKVKKGRLAHVRPAILRDVIGADVFDAIERAAVVRSPWSRIDSLYRYQRQRPRERVAPAMREIIDRSPSDFAVALCKRDYPTMSRFLSADDGRLLTTSLLRFEQLDEDFERWSRRFLGKPVALPKINRSTGDYRRDFSARAVKAVRVHFAEDFERFDYPVSPPD